jgi:5-hydroxyisourate hydrolase
LGSLTTHVLDAAQGKPAKGVPIALYRVRGEVRELVREAVTNSDGRIGEPLLTGARFEADAYELVFEIGAYFSNQGVPADEPPFLDAVTVRFTVSDSASHYHVPLLATPWSYTTYRGS